MPLPVLYKVWKQQPGLNFICNSTLFWMSSRHRKAYCQYLGDILTLETIFFLPDTWSSWLRHDLILLSCSQDRGLPSWTVTELRSWPGREHLQAPHSCTFPFFLTRAALLLTLARVRNRVDAQAESGFQGSCICCVTHGHSSTHPNLHPCQGALQMPSASAGRYPSQEN